MTADDVVKELRRALRRARTFMLLRPADRTLTDWQHALNDIHTALSRKVTKR